MLKGLRLSGLLCVLAASVLTLGCGLQPGSTTITFGGGKVAPPSIEAQESGLYTLYASNSGNALYTIELRRGEEYGFRKGADGAISAFARDKVIPLQNWLATSYFWKHRAK